MIDVVLRELHELRGRLERDALAHASLGADSHLRYIELAGRFKGISEAITIIESIMGTQEDRDV